ncbi:MAG TPA: ABC transporter substrate-binding protein [Chloroflexota bacterium]|nr:ABC transporter substrate-binding protein [Chloroflexota bacterium]
MVARATCLLVVVLLAACSGGSDAARSSAPAPSAVGATDANAASGAAAGAAPPAAPARQVIKYGSNPILTGAPLYLANDRGYFAEQGIELDYTPFDSGALAVAPTSAGQLDMTQSPPSPSYFNALARGVALTGIAATSYAETILLVRQPLLDSGEVRSVADLRGRRVSFNVEGSPIDYALRNMLPKEGVSLQEVEIQRLTNSDLPAALANGAVDAGAVSDPLPIERSGIGRRIRSSNDVLGKLSGSTLVIGPSMRARAAEVGVRFLVAYLKGLRDYRAALQNNRVVEPEVIEILSRWTHVPADAIAQSTAADLVPNGRIDLDDLNRQQDFWVREGLVPTRVDLAQFVDYHYLDAALARLP